MQTSSLCPICGEKIRLTGTTTDGRLIGSCGDAFTVAQWTDDGHGFPPTRVHAGQFAGCTVRGSVFPIDDLDYQPSGYWRFRVIARPWLERMDSSERVIAREYPNEKAALADLASAVVALDELSRQHFVEPVSAY